MTESELNIRKGYITRKLSDLGVDLKNKSNLGTLCRKDILLAYLIGLWKDITDSYVFGSLDNSITEDELKNIFTESEKLPS